MKKIVFFYTNNRDTTVYFSGDAKEKNKFVAFGVYGGDNVIYQNSFKEGKIFYEWLKKDKDKNSVMFSSVASPVSK